MTLLQRFDLAFVAVLAPGGVATGLIKRRWPKRTVQPVVAQQACVARESALAVRAGASCQGAP